VVILNESIRGGVVSSSLISTGTASAAPGGFGDICALSPVQNETYSNSHQAGCVEHALWRESGRLDSELLRRSWDMLALRHPILRTVFRRARKQPVQVIRKIATVTLNVHIIVATPEHQRQELLQTAMRQDRAIEFDLAEGPLFRVNVFQFDDDSWSTLLSFHPILMDGETVSMIRAEVAVIYRALQNGDPPLENDAPGIKDFILWFKRQDVAAAAAYWSLCLKDAVATVLPVERLSRDQDNGHRVVTSTVFLPMELTGDLKELAAQFEVSISTVLQAAWALLLGRHTGSADVVFGLTVNGRSRGMKDSSRIAGNFAHTLPVRVRWEASQLLGGFLESLQRQSEMAGKYSYMPLSQVWPAGGTPDTAGLMNTVFVDKTGVDSDNAIEIHSANGTADKFSSGLVLRVYGEDNLQVAVSYGEGVFAPAAIEGLLAHYQRLLEDMAAHRQSQVCDLEILTAGERERVLSFATGVALQDENLWRQMGVSAPRKGVGVYVLDGQRLAAAGCVGEIAISGLPESLTADGGKFAPAPNVSGNGGRLYLTGQKGRWKEDGSLELLTEAHSQSSTKTDHRHKEHGHKEHGRKEYVAPRTEAEKLVAEVWQEVLEVEQASVNDDFFDLGGQSLNTIQIRSRLSQKLGVNVPLKIIFANTLLEAQARAVAALKESGGPAGQGIPRLPKRSHYPVSYAQRRLWFLHRLDPDDRFYHTADYIVLDGKLDRVAFEQAFHELVKRQAILRTSFGVVADEPVQRISEDTLDISFHDLSGLPADEQTREMKRLQEMIPEWISSLETPPVGALLAKLAEEQHVFVLAIHHILSDEWSGQVVWRDLMEFYFSACHRKAAKLPEVRVSYADFSVWQKERIECGKLAESERYWMDRLGGDLPKLHLPVEKPQSGRPATDLLTETIEIAPEVSERLLAMGQAGDATPFMVKLALFKAFLARISGQHDILLGSTTAGRDHPDIEPLVGLFVNVVALRTDLAGDPAFAEILKRVRQSCVEAYAHQEYPFDLLIQRLAPVRDAGQVPLVQGFFADIPYAEPRVIEGLRFTPVDVSNGMAAGMGGRKLPVGFGMVCHDSGGGKMTWRFLFRADQFAGDTARRLARQFNAFLLDLAESPDRPLSKIQIVRTEGDEATLRRIAGRDEYPLSFNQRDMWFQRQIHGESGLNNLGASITLSGPLNPAYFQRALQAVIDRHDTLRTVFTEHDGVPCQKVITGVTLELPVLDLSGLGGQEQAAAVRNRERELIAAPYDFSAGPLVRAELLRLGESEHVLVFAFSHLILDGVYMAELFEQVAVSYEQILGGQPAALPPLELQYPDISTWQDERLRLGLLERHHSYWQQQLKAPVPAMSLPSDKDTHAVHSFELGFTQWPVRDDVFKGLKSFRKRYRTTVFRAVLAAFEVLLRRIVGENELLLGVPFSSLPAHVTQSLGFYGHAVPVRVTLDDQQPFTHLLNDVNEKISLAQEHLEYPLCEAVRGLQINRDPHRPLFPVVVSQIRNFDRAVGDLRMRMAVRHVHAGVYHLWLTVLESRDGLQLGFYYNREVLEGPALSMIRESLDELLAQVAANPEAPIRELGIVSAAEREKVLKEFAGMAVSPAVEDQGIVARIENQARRRARATAAVCGKEKLNYQQLNRNANRMANWLMANGVGRESRVGIFGNRGLEMLTTLLAVLKAGAAFVPLDPEHPDARLCGIIARAQIDVLATAGELAPRGLELSRMSGGSARVVCWHELPPGSSVPTPSTWASQPATNPGIVNQLHDLAYVCHTSGSTGIPKGAMVEHLGMLNHLLAKVGFLQLDKNSVVAQNASHCFDISIWQFFAALLVGGRVVIYPPESILHSGSMLSLIEQDGVTVLETVPSLLEVMLTGLPEKVKLSKLRHLISNAELLPVPLSRRWSDRFPRTILVNTYGATECSDDTTHQTVRYPGKDTVRIPVGRSIAGSQHYVLDHELQPLPAGCAGQVAIAGEVVGRGYLADPATTARKFVPDPFRCDGSRLYLTGDLGRWNSAGELEFLGRTDNQVKVHGHRVELGEIESALAKIPGLRQVAVIVSEETGSPSLIAYWVGDRGLDVNAMREHARKELPSYMVPAVFVRMTELPLTANGKVDRRALPRATETETGGFVPPRDDVEFRIARLWRDELGIPAAGVFDNFFELGGHSLKAVSLINRLQAEFRIMLPLRTLFDHQTIDSLSRVVRELCRNGAPAVQHTARIVPLQAGDPSALPLFLVHPHGGTVFCYQALATALGDHVPVFGIQCRGLEEGEQPLSSIPEMAAEYARDIRRVQPDGPYQIAGWSLGGPLAFETARQLEAGGMKVAFLGIFDSAVPSASGKGLELLPESASMEEFNSEMSMAKFARLFFRADERQFEGLSDAQIVDSLKEMAQRAGMLPPDVSPDMLKRFVAVAINSGIALFRYYPEGPVEADIVLFRAAQSLVDDPQWWAPFTRGEVRDVPAAGTHYDMVFPPAVTVLAAGLKQKLSNAPKARGNGQ
jgi:amino acid adenylation domain-containing protein